MSSPTMPAATLPCHAAPSRIHRAVARGFDTRHVLAAMKMNLELVQAMTSGSASALVAEALLDLADGIASLEEIADEDPPTVPGHAVGFVAVRGR